MQYRLAIAVLLAGLVLPSHLDAQRPGAGRSFAASPMRVGPGFTAMRPAPSPIRPVPMRPAPSGIQRSGFGLAPYGGYLGCGAFGASPCFPSPYYGGSFSRRRYFSGYGSSLWPVYVPSFGYVPAEYPPAAETPPPAPPQDSALAGQLERLADEVELLREEQASRAALSVPAATPRASVEEKPLPAVLVYRDGHQGEVQDYAILGRTLYVFAGQVTRRIPLADLNLEATEKLNDERGVQFIPSALP